jgi:hypothetical protein
MSLSPTCMRYFLFLHMIYILLQRSEARIRNMCESIYDAQEVMAYLNEEIDKWNEVSNSYLLSSS